MCYDRNLACDDIQHVLSFGTQNGAIATRLRVAMQNDAIG